jgi:hypothetical protein
MGQSKIPFFVYVDESGNTGHNVFDSAQPDYFSGALVSIGDFDQYAAVQIGKLTTKLGKSALHARKLGMKRIEVVAHELTGILDRAGVKFFVSRVEKSYLLASKLFDVLFDSGENPAVAWHHYNLRPMRLILTFKLASLLDEDIARRFWQAVVGENRQQLLLTLVDVCDKLLGNVHRIRDDASRKILSDGLAWIVKCPDCIDLNINELASRKGHFPNMVSFANLLDGLDRMSKDRKRRVAKIKHDKQNEFETTLENWHAMFSNADPREVNWGGERHSLQKVHGSSFEVCTDENSIGIQVVDTVLWLYNQLRKGNTLHPNCSGLMRYALSNGWESDFSFEGVERAYVNKYGLMLSKPLSKDQIEVGQKLLKSAEQRRLESMAEFANDRISPHARFYPTNSVQVELSKL